MSCGRLISAMFTLAGWTLVFCVTANAAPEQNHTVLDGKHDGASRGELASGAEAKEILVLDDATKARGTSASDGSFEATIFGRASDSGFGWFMKDDDVFGYGTWATQQIFGHWLHHGNAIFSAYDLFIFRDDSADPDVNASFMTEMWDGDPFFIMDTVCMFRGTSTPILETSAFSRPRILSTPQRLRFRSFCRSKQTAGKFAPLGCFREVMGSGEARPCTFESRRSDRYPYVPILRTGASIRGKWGR